MHWFYPSVIGIVIVCAAACGMERRDAAAEPESCRYAAYFRIEGDSLVIARSPEDGREDTLRTAVPLRRLICMSTSYIGYLDAIGCDSVIAAVSGKPFVTQPEVRERAADIGYEAALDYEAIVKLRPDVLLTYTVSAAEPPSLSKLRSLGIRVFVLYEHVERHPLARAEYVRLFGALTGRQAEADSVFAEVERNYLALSRCVSEEARRSGDRFSRRVLMNIPYRDAWYIPGAESYLARLVRDAGGEVAGAQEGEARSSLISVEQAYALSKEADFWLHTGWCSTLAQLRSVHPLFGDFPVIRKGVYNNTLRMPPGGGNDFWESGAVRADLILEDLVRILHPEIGEGEDGLHYYRALR